MTSLEARKALRDYDTERDKLKAGWPGWRIWYVPHTMPGGGMRIVWCAQPEPPLNCGSVEELMQEMRAADRPRFTAPPGWQPAPGGECGARNLDG